VLSAFGSRCWPPACHGASSRALSPGAKARADRGIASRWAEALPVAKEAVAILRERAAASPDRYHPGLAASLNNLGVCFWALGRPDEAATANDEAMKTRAQTD
jgi:hypothetical protein